MRISARLSLIERSEVGNGELRLAASIDDYWIEDFEVEGYSPHAVIKADVAV